MDFKKKCTRTPKCEYVAFLIEGQTDNSLDSDILACFTCKDTVFSEQTAFPIPSLASIKWTLSCAQNKLQKIRKFKEENSLDQDWVKLLPELEEFCQISMHLNNDFEELKITRDLKQRCSLSKCAKALLNSIFESETLRAYYKQQHCLEVLRMRDNGQESRPRQPLSLATIREEINSKMILPIKNKFKEALKLAEERKQEIEALKREINGLKYEIQDLNYTKCSLEEVCEQRFHQIQELKENNASLEQRIDDLSTEIDYKDELINQKSLVLSHSELKEMYNIVNFSLSMVDFNQDSNIHIDLNEEGSQKLVRCLQLCTLPDIKKIDVYNLKLFDQPNIISRFLKNGIQNVKSLKVGFCNGHSFGIKDCEPYIPPLLKVLPRIPHEISLDNFILEKDQFENLFVSAKKCHTIRFRCCKIFTDTEVDFGDRLENSLFEELDFYLTGSKDYSNWADMENSRFVNLLTGFSDQNHHIDRYISLSFVSCDLSQTTITDLFKFHNLSQFIWNT
ncbi:unnamed protein product [Moneuplotes crassus]|uniref:Uncharacterized protein n=1 Tax=Euplotes crassus TaxID=5936 RepID=A0AAD1YA40_EUPCR|nr:unnamed protein product [Moneuplotes crassus]